jgi:hypothetical protein
LLFVVWNINYDTGANSITLFVETKIDRYILVDFDFAHKWYSFNPSFGWNCIFIFLLFLVVLIFDILHVSFESPYGWHVNEYYKLVVIVSPVCIIINISDGFYSDIKYPHTYLFLLRRYGTGLLYFNLIKFYYNFMVII